MSDSMDVDAPVAPPTVRRGKTWLECRNAVKDSHKGISELSHRIPQSFTVCDGKTSRGEFSRRVYFLSALPGQRENTLVYAELPSDPSKASVTDALPWKPMLSQSQKPSGELSREEQLMRERKRIRSLGITSYDYQWYDESGLFAYSACNSLFICGDQEPNGKFITANSGIEATEMETPRKTSRMDPKLCPTTPLLVAFVSDSDLWVANIQSGSEDRLTFANNGSKYLSENSRSAGVASFVVQEEFDRYTGYWWQPCPQKGQAYHDRQKDASGRSVFRILYEEVDESEVRILNIVPPSNEGASVDEYRYPTAGTANAKSTIKIVEFSVDPKDNTVHDIKERQLVEPLHQLFPSMEYLVRAGWMPDGKGIYVELIDRIQKKLQLILIGLDSFQVRSLDASGAQDKSFSMSVLYEDTSDIWINVHDLLHFFPQENLDKLSFIRGCEKSGFLHLYHVTVELERSAATSNCSAQSIETSTGGSQASDSRRNAEVLTELVLTSGEWEVDAHQLWVDEATEMVYFIGYKDTPLETHLYGTSYRVPAAITRLTEPGFSHTVHFNKACNVFVTLYSSLSLPYVCKVYSLAVTDSRTVSANFLGTLLNAADSPGLRPPQLFSYESPSAGCALHGLLYQPSEFDASAKYPVILYVYGGPHIQLVNNSYKAVRFLRLHTWASLGFVVVVIDGRGSSNRGLQFAAHIRLKLGTLEMVDQVEGLEWLASRHPYIDMSRVGVHGWSYGGYLALMSIIQRPDIFKVVVAGAPVTSWHLYDTGYTERYMDLPTNNKDGYAAGSVIEAVEKFPNEDGRVLIVHGLMDENVHFYHTSSLVNALIKACKPHQLQVYPNERHGIRSPEANEHSETLLIYFLSKNL